MNLRRVVPCLHIRRRERFLKTSWSPADPNEFCHFHAGDAAFSSGAGEAASPIGAGSSTLRTVKRRSSPLRVFHAIDFPTGKTYQGGADWRQHRDLPFVDVRCIRKAERNHLHAACRIIPELDL